MSSAANKPDLTTATLDELVEELKARSTAMVLGIALKIDDERHVFIGNRLEIRGLIADLDDLSRSWTLRSFGKRGAQS